MSRYDELTAFVSVIEHGGFSAAADRLSIAKSAISRRVSELESRLGVRLMNRTTRRQSLTDEGRALYERAIRILADWDEAEQMVSSESAELSGRLKVATPLTFGVRHLGDVVAEFAQAHPDVRLEVDLSDREVDLIDEGFDMAIRIGKLADSTLVARRITDIGMTCVASPAYLNKHGIPATPDDLGNHLGLRYTLARRATLWRFRDDNGRVYQARPRTVLAANNGDHIAQCCAAGLGIALLPLFVSHERIRDGTLVPLLTELKVSPVSMYVVFPPGRYQSRRVRVFAEHIAAKFRDKGV